MPPDGWREVSMCLDCHGKKRPFGHVICVVWWRRRLTSKVMSKRVIRALNYTDYSTFFQITALFAFTSFSFLHFLSIFSSFNLSSLCLSLSLCFYSFAILKWILPEEIMIAGALLKCSHRVKFGASSNFIPILLTVFWRCWQKIKTESTRRRDSRSLKIAKRVETSLYCTWISFLSCILFTTKFILPQMLEEKDTEACGIPLMMEEHP